MKKFAIIFALCNIAITIIAFASKDVVLTITTFILVGINMLNLYSFLRRWY